jgi:hypothetical protein
MKLKDINVRPMRTVDIPQFEAWRRAYWDGDLELPKGWGAAGVETAIAEQAGSGSGVVPLESLTATLAVVIDPLIRNPQITDGAALVAGIYALERTLAYRGQQLGAVDAYIAIPNHLTDYHRIVEKAGYTETLEHCKVFRRPLMPDTHPLIGPEMEVQRLAILAAGQLAQSEDRVE